MVEDSMKNIRAAKELGMSTLLIAGLGSLTGKNSSENDALANAANATKAGDIPDGTDPSVDVCIEHIKGMKAALPELWGMK
jgi:beta-phosphoglucomutase-like phosphatase (HAD superfamily)